MKFKEGDRVIVFHPDQKDIMGGRYKGRVGIVWKEGVTGTIDKLSHEEYGGMYKVDFDSMEYLIGGFDHNFAYVPVVCLQLLSEYVRQLITKGG